MSRIGRIAPVAFSPVASPTDEFKAHHDVAAPKVDAKVRREAHAVRARLEDLVDLDRQSRDDHIGRAEYDAAERWRADFEAAEGVQDRGTLALGRISGGKSSDGITTRQIDATGRLRAVRDALGPVATVLLRQCVAYDTSWTELGRMVGMSDKTAKLRTCAALRALLAFYDRRDRVGGPDEAIVRATEFER